MSKIKILIVEDEPLIAEDIKEILLQVNYDVVGIAFTKEQAFEILKNSQPDFALLDINLGNNTDGILIAERINQQYHIPFLYLTSYSTKIILDKVRHTFPMGYIVKPFDEADLFTGIEIALSNFQGRKKTNNLSIELINKNLPNKLTNKEYDILIEMYNGLTNKEISEKHFVSLNTIKTHVQKIYEKLDVHTRAIAIVKVREILNL
jgi:DNA-binding NarL/FixJ family response regulator